MSLKPSLNWLLVFVPITLLLDHLHAAAPLVFFSAALSIVPIAGGIVRSTEQIALRTGDAVGGLLNATFGNAPELIIMTVALRAGFPEMVIASLVGAVLVNLLLGLGMAFLLGGLKYHEQTYNAGALTIYGTMMMMAVLSLAIPSAFSQVEIGRDLLRQKNALNLGVAAYLLVAYGLYLVFMLKTHPDTFRSAESPSHESERRRWSLPRAAGGLLVASVLAGWMSEILVGAAEETGEALGMSSVFIGIVFLAIVGGAAEGGSAIAMARKNKMDLAIGIAFGSCIQVALFVAPMLVLASLFLAPEPLMLSFGRAQMAALLMAVALGVMVSGGGRSNWYKGVQLVTMYLIIASLFYFLPAATPGP
ncbi:MAG: calcium/proton exchanger [Candidatus Eisenbacteria bacterium]